MLARPYIFVSYAHKDSETVVPVINALKQNGFAVWYDSGIEAGTEWPAYIESHLKECAVVLIFMSNDAVASRNCRNEINLASKLNKDMLVVYLEKTELAFGLDLQLSSTQSLYFYTQSKDSFMNSLLTARLLRPCQQEAEEKAPDYNELLDNFQKGTSTKGTANQRKTETPMPMDSHPAQTKPSPNAYTPATPKDAKAYEEAQKMLPRLLYALNDENKLKKLVRNGKIAAIINLLSLAAFILTLFYLGGVVKIIAIVASAVFWFFSLGPTANTGLFSDDPTMWDGIVMDAFVALIVSVVFVGIPFILSPINALFSSVDKVKRNLTAKADELKSKFHL